MSLGVRELQEDSKGKAIFASGFLLFILIQFCFSFPFWFLKTKSIVFKPCFLEILHLAILDTALS